MSTSLDALIRDSSEVVLLVDEGGRLAFASTSAARLFGFDPIGLVGRPITDIVSPDDHPAFAAAQTRAATAEQVVSLALIRPGGDLHDVELAVRPLVDSRGCTGWLLRTIDLSTAVAIGAARSGDDTGFRDLAACSPFVIFRLDKRGGLIELNERWTAITGQPLTMAAGAGWLTVIEDEDRRPFRAVAASAHESGRGWRHAFRVRHRSGEIRWVDAASEPLPNGRGEVGVVVDITAEIGLQRETLARR